MAAVLSRSSLCECKFDKDVIVAVVVLLKHCSSIVVHSTFMYLADSSIIFVHCSLAEIWLLSF